MPGRAKVAGLSLAALTLLALLPLSGCPLTTFEVDQSGAASGAAGAAGGPSQNGGNPSAGGVGGHAGGVGNVTRPRAVDDRYVILQGEDLRVPAERGVLANDTPVNLRATAPVNSDPRRPIAFDAKLSVAEDGSFHFTPSPRFFGQYRFSYTAVNASGQAAVGNVEIHVVPADIDLDAVVEGLGGYVLSGPPGSGLGAALDRAFDVNGDGLRDLVVGAPAAEGGAGAAFVVFGKSDLRSVELAPLSATTSELRFASISAGARDGLGVSVSGLGDWNGDGTPDLMLGANAGNGRAYVVSGADVAGRVALPTPRGYVLEGDTANLDVGRVVVAAGDVNGDGVADALVSATNLDYGWIHVVFGSTGLLGRAAVTGAPGLHVRAAAPLDGFPSAAAGVGDLDGDGAAEVLASSDTSIVVLRGGIGYPPDVGQLSIDGAHGGWSVQRVQPGAASVAALGDVNGDRVPDFGYCEGASFCRVVFGPPSTLTSGWLLKGFSPNARSLSLAGGGDVDGDGLADVLLADERRAYVVYGKRGGFSDLDVGQLGVDGYSVLAASGGAITAIECLGDSDGDGLADLALADATAEQGSGRVYVLFGVASR